MRRQYNVLFESPDGIDEEKCLAEDEGDSSASGDMPAVTVAIETLPDDKNNYLHNDWVHPTVLRATVDAHK